jgi:3-deoxy-D-manno-octulosonic-acid transferase
LIWVHAASVGETVAALPLIERLVERRPALLLTTGTVTAATIAAARLPDAAIHQFQPIDTPRAVDRFLRHWRPDLALFAESELWPTTVAALAARRTPLAVFNARMSQRSFRMWRAASPLAAAMLARVQLVLAQSELDGERLRRLGARQVVVCGNLKFDAPPPPADEDELAMLRRSMAGRPVLLAASTHADEEARLVAAHAGLRAALPNLLTILAPRHPERGGEIGAIVAAAGLSLRRRSQDRSDETGADVLLADTIGEMGLWYRLADVAFLGGSMAPRGGQNPIEAAKLGVPIVHGPHVENFRDVYGALAQAGAVRCVTNDASLGMGLRGLLGDAAERTRMAQAACACVERLTGALQRTTDALEPYLAALGNGHAASARS